MSSNKGGAWKTVISSIEKIKKNYFRSLKAKTPGEPIIASLDVSLTGIRYAVGRRINEGRQSLEILALGEVTYPESKYDEAGIVAAIKEIQEHALEVFALEINIVHLAIPLGWQTINLNNTDKSVFEIVESSGIHISGIHIAGEASSEAALFPDERRVSCVFVDFSRTGVHININSQYGARWEYLLHAIPSSFESKEDIVSIVSAINDCISAHSPHDKYLGIIVTGELANYPNLIDMVESVTGLPCRIARPSIYVRQTETPAVLGKGIYDPSYSTAIGLLLLPRR